MRTPRKVSRKRRLVGSGISPHETLVDTGDTDDYWSIGNKFPLARGLIDTSGRPAELVRAINKGLTLPDNIQPGSSTRREGDIDAPANLDGTRLQSANNTTHTGQSHGHQQHNPDMGQRSQSANNTTHTGQSHGHQQPNPDMGQRPQSANNTTHTGQSHGHQQPNPDMGQRSQSANNTTHTGQSHGHQQHNPDMGQRSQSTNNTRQQAADLTNKPSALGKIANDISSTPGANDANGQLTLLMFKKLESRNHGTLDSDVGYGFTHRFSFNNMNGQYLNFWFSVGSNPESKPDAYAGFQPHKKLIPHNVAFDLLSKNDRGDASDDLKSFTFKNVPEFVHTWDNSRYTVKRIDRPGAKSSVQAVKTNKQGATPGYQGAPVAPAGPPPVQGNQGAPVAPAGPPPVQGNQGAPVAPAGPPPVQGNQGAPVAPSLGTNETADSIFSRLMTKMSPVGRSLSDFVLPQWLLSATNIGYAAFVAAYFGPPLLEHLIFGDQLLYVKILTSIFKITLGRVESLFEEMNNDAAVDNFKILVSTYAHSKCPPFHRKQLDDLLMGIIYEGDEFADGTSLREKLLVIPLWAVNMQTSGAKRQTYGMQHIEGKIGKVDVGKEVKKTSKTPFLGLGRELSPLSAYVSLAAACLDDGYFKYMFRKLTSAVDRITEATNKGSAFNRGSKAIHDYYDEQIRDSVFDGVQVVIDMITRNDGAQSRFQLRSHQAMSDIMDKERDEYEKTLDRSILSSWMTKMARTFLGSEPLLNVGSLVTIPLTLRVTRAAKNLAIMASLTANSVAGVPDKSSSSDETIFRRIAIITQLVSNILGHRKRLSIVTESELETLLKVCEQFNSIFSLCGATPQLDPSEFNVYVYDCGDKGILYSYNPTLNEFEASSELKKLKQIYGLSEDDIKLLLKLMDEQKKESDELTTQLLQADPRAIVNAIAKVFPSGPILVNETEFTRDYGHVSSASKVKSLFEKFELFKNLSPDDRAKGNTLFFHTNVSNKVMIDELLSLSTKYPKFDTKLRLFLLPNSRNVKDDLSSLLNNSDDAVKNEINTQLYALFRSFVTNNDIDKKLDILRLNSIELITTDTKKVIPDLKKLYRICHKHVNSIVYLMKDEVDVDVFDYVKENDILRRESHVSVYIYNWLVNLGITNNMCLVKDPNMYRDIWAVWYKLQRPSSYAVQLISVFGNDNIRHNLIELVKCDKMKETKLTNLYMTGSLWGDMYEFIRTRGDSGILREPWHQLKKTIDPTKVFKKDDVQVLYDAVKYITQVPSIHDEFKKMIWVYKIRVFTDDEIMHAINKLGFTDEFESIKVSKQDRCINYDRHTIHRLMEFIKHREDAMSNHDYQMSKSYYKLIYEMLESNRPVKGGGSEPTLTRQKHTNIYDTGIPSRVEELDTFECVEKAKPSDAASDLDECIEKSVFGIDKSKIKANDKFVYVHPPPNIKPDKLYDILKGILEGDDNKQQDILLSAFDGHTLNDRSIFFMLCPTDVQNVHSDELMKQQIRNAVIARDFGPMQRGHSLAVFRLNNSVSVANTTLNSVCVLACVLYSNNKGEFMSFLEEKTNAKETLPPVKPTDDGLPWWFKTIPNDLNTYTIPTWFERISDSMLSNLFDPHRKKPFTFTDIFKPKQEKYATELAHRMDLNKENSNNTRLFKRIVNMQCSGDAYETYNDFLNIIRQCDLNTINQKVSYVNNSVLLLPLQPKKDHIYTFYYKPQQKITVNGAIHGILSKDTETFMVTAKLVEKVTGYIFGELKQNDEVKGFIGKIRYYDADPFSFLMKRMLVTLRTQTYSMNVSWDPSNFPVLFKTEVDDDTVLPN